jgi:hypothetical protein
MVEEWLRLARQYLDSQDYVSARQLVQKALETESGDSRALELLAALDRLEQEKSRADSPLGEAQRLLAQGQELCAQSRLQEGTELLRRARRLDEQDPAIRAALVDALLEQARPLIDLDWRAAEALVQQALDLDANHFLAKSLRTLAHDRKREEEMVRCFSEVRQLRAVGDLKSALARAEECLASYSLEPRLIQLRDILTREFEDSQRGQPLPADLDELKRLEQEFETAPNRAAAEPLVERARIMARKYPDNPEIQSTVADLERRLGKPKVDFERAFAGVPPQMPTPEPPTAPTATSGFGPVPGVPKTPQEAEVTPESMTAFLAGPEPPQPAVPPAKQPPKPASAPPPRPKRAAAGGLAALLSRRSVLWGIAATAALLGFIIAAVFVAPRLRRARPPVARIAVELRTTPPGATLRVDGQVRGTSNLKTELPPGTYQLEALMEGYQPASATLTVKPGPMAPLELTLQPWPQTVRLVSDLGAGQVWLDDQPPRELQEGQLTLETLAPGKHNLKVSDRYGEASFEFEILPGAAPLIGGPVTAKNVVALLVSSAGGRLRLYSSLAAAKISLDNQPAGEVGPPGLELPNISYGTHELLIGEGADRRKFIVDIGSAPALTAFLQSNRNLGTLLLLTSEDNVTVFLNDQKYPRPTRRGQLRITREPREYRVRVAKEGFLDEPEQAVRIRKGEEAKLEFKLRPVPKLAALSIRGAPPGAQVFLDQIPIGTVAPDGSFSSSNVSPGEHAVELRKEKFRPRQFHRIFAAGQAVQLSENEVAMGSLFGTLRLAVTPATAQVTIARAGEAQPRPVTGNTLELEEGSYTLVARAPGYNDRTERVQIVAGKTAPIDLSLSSREIKRPIVTTAGMEGWEKGWTSDGAWSVRRGGGLVLYRPTPNGGTFAFTVVLAAGGGILRGKQLEWVVDYTDDRNYLLFRLDKEYLRRIQCVNGRRTELARVAHGLLMKEYLRATLQVDILPGSITHKVSKGKDWVVVDTWSAPGLDLSAGRFGFWIQGRDEVRLSDFGFYPSK